VNSKIFQKFSSIGTHEARPLQASLELTYRCNERCTHCYVEKFADDPDKVLSLKDWYKILQELRSAGTLYLILMGGEPMLSPFFFDICQKATDMGFHVSMISNGLKVKTPEVAARLKSSGLRMATFSLYSLDPAVHDKITSVRGSFEKLMAAIDYCEAEGVHVTINSLLTEANSRGIFELYEWGMRRGFELKVDPNITPKLNGDLEPTHYRATKETLVWFYRERAKRWLSSLPGPNLEASSDYICNAAKGKCAVNPYGELLPCIEIREPFGSLVKESFADIWYSEPAKRWREPRLTDMKGEDLDSLYSFCDHCPGMAKNENGKPFEMLPYSKVVAAAKKQVHEEFKDLL